MKGKTELMKGKTELLKAFDEAVAGGRVERRYGGPEGSQLVLFFDTCRYTLTLVDTPEGIAARRKELGRQATWGGHSASYIECQRALRGLPPLDSICYGKSEPVYEDAE